MPAQNKKPKNPKRNNKNSQPEKSAPRLPSKFKQDIVGIFLIALAVFIFVANLSSSTGLIGLFLVKNILRSALGVGVYVLPIFIALYGIILLLRHEVKELTVRLTGLSLLYLTYIVAAQYYSSTYFASDVRQAYFQGAGGAIGYGINFVLMRSVGLIGSYIVIIASTIVSLLMLFNVTVLTLVSYFMHLLRPEAAKEKPEPKKMPVQLPLGAEKKEEKPKPAAPPPLPVVEIISSTISKEEKEYKEKPTPRVTIHKEPKVVSEKIKTSGKYKLPPLDLLDEPTAEEIARAKSQHEQIQNRKEQLENALRSFGVGAHVTAIYQGPAVTRYEVQPEPGVKVSRINNLSNDISLAMAAQGIRIEAPVPGKSVVGIEVPNPIVTPVRLREIAESKTFQSNPSKLAFCIGKDLSGHPVVGDLSKMPHLLIAGTTGSGKSVCINSLITSILLRAEPDEVKFIMIDPKMVELSIYDGIAHLAAPVVTNVKKAAITLKAWVLKEMDRRYQLFHDTGSRNIAAYNKRFNDKDKRLPYLVVVVDELADLMMVAAQEVEGAICRIAQMARATGIHMVIATQRPSVDVITGLIKANIPSRIAFAVATQIDSRVILDSSGAEKLLGRGDMLYNPIGAMKPTRLQGSFVSDQEAERVIEFITEQCEPEYIEEIAAIKALDFGPSSGSQGESTWEGSGDRDPLFVESIKILLNGGNPSTSFLQRRLKIGYNRAARIMDEIEAAGLVSKSDGDNKPRKFMASAEKLKELGVSLD